MAVTKNCLALRNVYAISYYSNPSKLSSTCRGRNIVNQLLAEMDSVGSDNQNVFIQAATNQPSSSQQHALQAIDPMIKMCYQDELARRSRISRMGTGAMVTL